MATQLREAEPAAARKSPVPEIFPRKDTMIAEDAGRPILEQHRVPDRKLRNRILVVNAIAWVLIIVVIRLIFF